MSKNVKALGDEGLTALCGHISNIKTTADNAGSAVVSLAEATAETVEEIETILNGIPTKTNAVSITIPTTNWKNDSNAYPKYYDIAVTGVTANDRATVTIAPSSIAAAQACGICPTNETIAGYIRIRATSVPTTAISAEYWIDKGKEA